MAKQLIWFAIKNRWLILAGIVVTVFLGIATFAKMPIDVYPDINDPRITILTEAHGWSPEEVEKLVTFPMERVFNGAPFIKRVRSSSGVGISVIFVEFEWGTDIFRARQMVSERLQTIVLPEGIEPFMAPITSRLGEIVEYAFEDETGEYDPMELRDLADWVVRFRLQSVGGIANVINIGGFVKQYQVLASPEKMISFGIALEEVREALAESNLNVPGGFLLSGHKEYLIRGLGRVSNIEDIENVVIATREHGLPILVKDIAEVRIGGPIARRGAGTLNMEETALGKVSKQPGTNTIKVTENILQAFEELKVSLPEGVSLKPEYIQADLIKRSVDNVKKALFLGAILVVIILFLFILDIRPVIITLTAIPLSLLLSVIFLNWLGLTINIMVLGGLAIAIGMVVDDAIIDVENTNRRLLEYFRSPTKETTAEVNLRGSYEIWYPAFFATMIILLVFIPLFALPGIEGRMFSPLALTVVVAMIASLFVSTWATPCLCQFLLTCGRKIKPETETFIVRKIIRFYRPLLEKILNRPKLVILFAGSLVILALLLFRVMGTEFLPIMDEGTFVVNAVLPPETSLKESIRMGRLVEKALHDIPEVTSTSTRTGRAEQDEHAEGVNYNEILVNLLPPEERGKSREEMLKIVREKLSPEKFPGIVISIGQPIQHRIDHLLSGVSAQVAIKLFGEDLNNLRQKAKEIEQVASGIEGVEDLQIEPQVAIPQLRIEIDRKEIARHGLSVASVAHFIETAYNGEVVSQVILGQRKYDLIVLIGDKYRSDIEMVRNLKMRTPSGAMLPLKRLADIRFGTGPNTINRENVSRRIVIQCNVAGRDLGGFISELREEVNKRVDLPEGYFITYGGQFEAQQEAMKKLLWQTVIVILAIFLLLYLHFDSPKIAFLIMLNLPLALVGGVVSVFLSGGILSVSSAVGFILLFGIAVRNGIVLVTYINKLREEGLDLKNAIFKGAETRISPILMTALTTGLGMLPLALTTGSGAEIQKPLAIVILGGMITSTILTLLVLPCLYYMMEVRSAKKAQILAPSTPEGNEVIL